jgi:TonB-linked SusC/RagA family outer membrane protein
MKKVAHFLDGSAISLKKTLLVMKISVFLLLLALQISAKNSAQDRITLDLKGTTLANLFKAVEKQTVYRFFYSDDVVPVNMPVSITVRDASIDAVMNKIFAGSAFSWKLLDGRSVIVARNAVAPVAETIATGTVTDEKGEPLAGVTVTEKGTDNSTLTDRNGQFKLKLSGDNATLVFSSIGYTAQESKVNGQSGALSIVLKTAVQGLNEVVVVGYGTRKVSDLTGAVVNIKAENTNAGGVTTAVDQMLAGRVAGVQFKQNSSQPGGGSTLLIRGRNSLFLNTSPLYVIDGFIVNSPETPGTGTAYFSSPDKDPLNSINPADIESIAVLKDAAATAIYGAKGSNGVVIITTKRGRKGQVKVSYDGSYSFQKMAKKFEVMNAPQYMNFWNKLGSTSFTADQIANAKTTDWLDQITRTGQIQNHNVSLAGATDNLNYYFSVGYFDNQGIVKNSGMKRITGRGNLQYSKDKFTFNSNIFATNMVNNNQQTDGGTRSSVIASAITFAPYLGVRDSTGAYTRDPNNNFLINPVSLLDITDKLTTDKLNFSVGALYEIVKGLKPEIRVTYDVQNDNRLFYVPTTTAYNGNIAHGGTGSQTSQRGLGYTLNGLLHYDVTFADKHKITALGGYEYYYRSTSMFSALNSGFGTDLTGGNNLGGGTSAIVSSNKFDRKDISVFGRVDYTYNEKYLATVTLRRDGSSVFGSNNKFATFPGVSIGWKLDKEDFLAGHKNLDVLKLRAGYGVTGNSGITPYQSLSTYAQGINPILGPATTGIIGQNPVVGATLTPGKANPNLKWESTSQFNIGADYGFFRRITGSLDFFVKNTDNMLVQVNLPTTTGYNFQWQNAATMRTWGVEFSINSTNIQTDNFQWNTMFNFSWLNNKITGYKTGDSSTIAALNTIGVIKGQRTNSYYTYVADGIDPATGSIRFKDLDKNGTINSNDRQVVGSPDPRFILGLGNTLSYKKVTLSFFFTGNFGNKLHNQTMAQYTVPNANNIANAFVAAQNYWSTANPNSDIPANAGNGGGSWIYNTRWIEQAWFIRLQNVNLSYNIPTRHLGHVFSNARVYLQAQNLFVITPYKGMDPEASNNAYLAATQNMPAFLPGSTDINAYPPVRTFTVGLNLGF